jgi:hypothetical protein
MEDKHFTLLTILCLFLGIVVLFFSLNYEPEDAFFEINNDIVFLEGKVVRASAKAADVLACRTITVFGEGFSRNDEVVIEGSMFNGKIEVKNIKRIN